MEGQFSLLLSGFIGAILGGAFSLAGIWVQQRLQTKRERTKLATEIALKQYQYTIEEKQTPLERKMVPPFVVWQHINLRVLEAMDSGKLDEATIYQIWKESDELEQTLAAFREIELAPKASK